MNYFLARKRYNPEKFDVRHFCPYQNPPCSRIECQVAAHIIVGLFPMNFVEFLLTSYYPLGEWERNEVINIKNLYYAYLMQRFYDGKKTDADFAHDGWTSIPNLDSAIDYTLVCVITSAMAETHLIDLPIPVKEVLESCFVVEDNDIRFNKYWLECIYMLRANEDSPLNNLYKDPKVMELQLLVQLDNLGLNQQIAISEKPKKILEKVAKIKEEGSSGEEDKKIRFLIDSLKDEMKEPLKESRPSKGTTRKIVKSIRHLSQSSAMPAGANVKTTTSTTTKLCCDSHKTAKTADKEKMIDAVALAVKQTLNQ